MMTRYAKRRSLLLDLLQCIDLECHPQEKSFLGLSELIIANRHKKSKTVSLHRKQIDLKWLTDRALKKLVVIKSDANSIELNRRYLELAWFLKFKDLLKSKDCFVNGASDFSDNQQQLITDHQYDELIDDYVDQVGFSKDGAEFTKNLKEALTTAAERVDHDFPGLDCVSIKDEKLVLKQVKAKSENKKQIDQFKSAVKKRIPKTNIIDALTFSVKWLDLKKLFGPISGLEGKVADPVYRLVATLFCFGCNVGVTATADALKGLSRKQVAWLNVHYSTLTTLTKSIEKAVSVYNTMALPNIWGSGDHASGDGTHHTMYDKNILAEFHFRYRKKGAIGYYIVSDKYIALFSSLIPCGVHESLYILDSVMQDELDIKPNTYNGDTHAQSYAVFGLAHLMGIDLMPRIRGINRLKFYKPDGRIRYKNISHLFNDKIDWKLIENQLPKMLRIVLSIQQGTITPSAILKQMNADSTKNKVALAFRELGRVVRTLFLLRYISDYELRCFIQQQTNKSEQFNEFAKWIFFANDGKIRDNQTVNQEKIIKYNHLTANLLAIYNTHQPTKTLNEMKAEGMQINEGWAKYLSPYLHGNLNRLGEYNINTNQKIENLVVDITFGD